MTVVEAASIASGASKSEERQPSAVEDTYIHLLSKTILRARMLAHPGVREAEARRARQVAEKRRVREEATDPVEAEKAADDKQGDSTTVT
jgi:hypothetical protein